MLDLIYKIRLIWLLEKYWKFFYEKTTLYRHLFKNYNWNLSINYEKISEIEDPKRIYKQLKNELDFAWIH